MKKTNLGKALLCIVLCLSLVLSFAGCGKTKNDTSDTEPTTDAVYGDPSKCTLCPVKEYCCFCYQYGDCVCDEVEEREENSKETILKTIQRMTPLKVKAPKAIVLRVTVPKIMRQTLALKENLILRP